MDGNQVMEDIGRCLAEFRLPILIPHCKGSDYALSTRVLNRGLRMEMHINYIPEKRLVALIVCFLDILPKQLEKDVYHVINEFNSKLAFNHFSICRQENRMTLRSGYFLSEEGFNKEKFLLNFRVIIGEASDSYPQLKGLMLGGEFNA